VAPRSRRASSQSAGVSAPSLRAEGEPAGISAAAENSDRLRVDRAHFLDAALAVAPRKERIMKIPCLPLVRRAWARGRWLVLGAAVAALWACTSHGLVAPTPAPSVSERHRFRQTLDRKLDLLFMIDNSQSMEPLQAKLARNLPVLVRGLEALPGGLPDLHVAVVSSSVQPGRLNDQLGCEPTDLDDGRFRHAFNPSGLPNHPECQGLTLAGSFIRAGGGAPANFTGRLEDVFGCIALLGQTGCGFEQPFGAIVRALDPDRPVAGNEGFVRDDAYLGVVLLTNEDDCTAPPDTALFDDEQGTSAGPRGRLASYRCTEFGIACDGRRPPHTLGPHETVAETGCAPAEADGALVKTADVEAFLLWLKHGDRGKVLVAAISGPPTPFAVSSFASRSSPASETDPSAPGLVPSCVSANGFDYADPGVRLARVVDDLGGVSFNICEEDYGPAMAQIAQALGRRLGPECLPGPILNDAAGQPDCVVTARSFASDGSPREAVVPFCGATAVSNAAPCWRLLDAPADCPAGRLFRVCRDAACGAPAGGAVPAEDVTVECAVAPPDAGGAAR
jgi:hypothetical protein